MHKILVIQTAFIGDAILATSILEKLHHFYPNSQVDYLIRKGNESLFSNHPYIKNLWIWDKKGDKFKSQFRIIKKIRNEKYDLVVNCQRFTSSGIFTVLSGAKVTVGFKSNPLSFLFTQTHVHNFDGLHETERNQKLITQFTDHILEKPKLYPDFRNIILPSDIEFDLQNQEFITISPSSVWFTKQYPKEKWIEFIEKVPAQTKIFLLGAKSDSQYNELIINSSKRKNGIYNLAGSFSLLQSAALMSKAKMNYVNDSAPMHLCSAVNAPVTAIYCSTVPKFGFGPLSDLSFIVETPQKLECKPCGIHGHAQCPLQHFECGYGINTEQLLATLS